MNQLFTKAIKDGRYVSIEEFGPRIGARCGCICPECGEPVQSNVTGKKREELKIDFTNHFSHVNKDTKCSGGHAETEIHLKAKELIEQNDSIKVPGLKRGSSQTIKYSNVRLETAFPKSGLKRYRPDIIVTTEDGEELAIEVIVSSPVTEVKKQIYRDNQFQAFEIDLTWFKRWPFEKYEFRLPDMVLENTNNKQWIWPEQFVEAEQFDEAQEVEEVEEVEKVAPKVLKTLKSEPETSSLLNNPLVWVGGIIAFVAVVKSFFSGKR